MSDLDPKYKVAPGEFTLDERYVVHVCRSHCHCMRIRVHLQALKPRLLIAIIFVPCFTFALGMTIASIQKVD